MSKQELPAPEQPDSGIEDQDAAGRELSKGGNHETSLGGERGASDASNTQAWSDTTGEPHCRLVTHGTADLKAVDLIDQAVCPLVPGVLHDTLVCIRQFGWAAFEIIWDLWPSRSGDNFVVAHRLKLLNPELTAVETDKETGALVGLRQNDAFIPAEYTLLMTTEPFGPVPGRPHPSATAFEIAPLCQRELNRRVVERILTMNLGPEASGTVELRIEVEKSQSKMEQANTGFEGFVPADTLDREHGIRQSRLSEAVRKGDVKTLPAPKGLTSSQGKRIQKLYNEADAIKHCSPKRSSGKKPPKKEPRQM